MQINWLLNDVELNLEKTPLEILREKWNEAWGIHPPSHIGRTMLIKSLKYKVHEHRCGPLSFEYKQRLDLLIKFYKRNPKCFEINQPALKPGMRLIRDWNGIRHSVLIQNSGYEYNGKIYNSLSQISSEITGTRWNGWVFFGLKKRGANNETSN